MDLLSAQSGSRLIFERSLDIDLLCAQSGSRLIFEGSLDMDLLYAQSGSRLIFERCWLTGHSANRILNLMLSQLSSRQDVIF